MKDYSLIPEQRKEFILSYVIKNKKIIVKLASGEKYIVPYNKENERIILTRMENQIKCVNEFEDKCKQTVKSYKKWTMVFLGLFIASNILLTIGVPFPLIIITTVATTGLGFITNSICYFRSKNTLNDIIKQKYFLANHEQLNANVKKNKNILLSVSKKAKRQIKQTSAKKPVFDINTIDKLSLKDLKTLRYNILRDENFGFIQEDTTNNGEKDKARVLTSKNSK